MNRLSRTKQAQVVAALVEGNSIRSTERMTGVAKHTILKLLADLGPACAEYQDRALRNLNCRRIQVDEIWQFCYAKELGEWLFEPLPSDKKEELLIETLEGAGFPYAMLLLAVPEPAPFLSFRQRAGRASSNSPGSLRSSARYFRYLYCWYFSRQRRVRRA